jgi:peptidoglycan hydrolase-like protein with peptidoglycan-binding domain
MKKLLLASLAALPLLAITVLPASAQDLKQQGAGKAVSQPQGGGKTGAHPSQAVGKSQGTKVSQGAAQPKSEARGPAKQAGRAESRTVGQGQTQNRAQERGKAQATQNRPAGQHQANPGKGKTQLSQGGKIQGGKSQLSQSQKVKAPAATQTGGAQTQKQTQREPARTTGQTSGTQRNEPVRSSGQTGKSGQVENRGTTSGGQGNVTLNEEQRTRIQQTVLAGRNVPRVNRVDFSLNIGTVVPSHVRFVAVPTVLIDIHPEWQGDEYFVVRDEIVIVDRSRRILAIMPIGSSSASIGTRGPGFAGGTDIREVQQVLIEKGFYHGPVDGVLGRATREALIAFQRQQGIAVTGRIDTRTMASLRISGRTQGQSEGRTGGRELSAPSQNTSGRNVSGQNGSGQRNAARAKEGRQVGRNAQHPTTTGQGGKSQPSIKQGSKPGPGGTTGQSASQRRQNQPAQGGAKNLNQ